MNLREQSTHIEDDFAERSAEAWRYKYVEHNQNYVVMSIIDALEDKPAAVKVYGMYKLTKNKICQASYMSLLRIKMETNIRIFLH